MEIYISGRKIGIREVVIGYVKTNCLQDGIFFNFEHKFLL